MQEIQINGALGEGGGQVLRTSLSLSAITQQPFKIFNIRFNRQPQPHLRPQHVMAAKAIQTITNGILIGAEVDSKSFSFIPKNIVSGNYEFDVGTAGSTILVAQTIIPALLTCNEQSKVRIIGGTNLPYSPCYDYFVNVFLKAINKFGAQVDCCLIRSGYYPSGGGILEIIIKPSKLIGVTKWLSQDEPQATIRVANLPLHIGERQKKILVERNYKLVNIYEEKTFSPGNVITLWKGFKGSCELGRPGKLAEKVVQEVITSFEKETKEVDCHLADQLMIYAILAKGESKYTTSTITNHIITNQSVISNFIKRKTECIHNSILVYAT
jgi:RNA 3'-terminal phosphate cyclase (ATP)